MKDEASALILRDRASRFLWYNLAALSARMRKVMNGSSLQIHQDNAIAEEMIAHGKIFQMIRTTVRKFATARIVDTCTAKIKLFIYK
jgi:hypothetical protein